MNKYEKEIEQTLLNNEKAMLKQLETTYIKALADVKGRLRLLQAREETSSVIYQINYQKSLESQINAILGVLKQDNITNVQDFLNHMYEDGYLGVQYSLLQQGVPVVTAINQDEVSKSLFKQLGRMTFADRLNVNMNDFKTKIKDTISRGIASASTYKDIAAQLSLVTGEEMYKSYRIARTEGHRITAEAKLNSMKKAKQQGADVVKQWDATLDGKTRKNHRKLDGQWVEVDDYFEIGGRKVKAPGKFGRAEEDINCRCILLTRPRWAVDKKRVKSAKISDEYGKEVEKLIEVKNYDDYKKGYYRVLEDNPDIEKKIKNINISLKEFGDITSKKTSKFKPAETIREVQGRIQNSLGATVELNSVNMKMANEYLNAIEDFTNEFPQLKGFIDKIDDNTREGAGGTFQLKDHKGTVKATLKLTNMKYEDFKKTMEYNEKINFHFKGNNAYTTAIHELTHAMDCMLDNKKMFKYDNGFLGTINDGGDRIAQNFQSFFSENNMFGDSIIKQAKKEMFGTTAYDEIKDDIAFLGEYALKADSEMLAECIAYEYSGQTNKFSAKVKELFLEKIKETFG